MAIIIYRADRVVVCVGVQVQRLRVARIGVRNRIRVFRPIGGHEASEATGHVAGFEIIKAIEAALRSGGFGAAFFAVEFMTDATVAGDVVASVQAVIATEQLSGCSRRADRVIKSKNRFKGFARANLR